MSSPPLAKAKAKRTLTAEQTSDDQILSILEGENPRSLIHAMSEGAASSGSRQPPAPTAGCSLTDLLPPEVDRHVLSWLSLASRGRLRQCSTSTFRMVESFDLELLRSSSGEQRSSETNELVAEIELKRWMPVESSSVSTSAAENNDDSTAENNNDAEVLPGPSNLRRLTRGAFLDEPSLSASYDYYDYSSSPDRQYRFYDSAKLVDGHLLVLYSDYWYGFEGFDLNTGARVSVEGMNGPTKDYVNTVDERISLGLSHCEGRHGLLAVGMETWCSPSSNPHGPWSGPYLSVWKIGEEDRESTEEDRESTRLRVDLRKPRHDIAAVSVVSPNRCAVLLQSDTAVVLQWHRIPSTSDEMSKTPPPPPVPEPPTGPEPSHTCSESCLLNYPESEICRVWAQQKALWEKHVSGGVDSGDNGEEVEYAWWPGSATLLQEDTVSTRPPVNGQATMHTDGGGILVVVVGDEMQFWHVGTMALVRTCQPFDIDGVDFGPNILVGNLVTHTTVRPFDVSSPGEGYESQLRRELAEEEEEASRLAAAEAQYPQYSFVPPSFHQSLFSPHYNGVAPLTETHAALLEQNQAIQAAAQIQADVSAQAAALVQQLSNPGLNGDHSTAISDQLQAISAINSYAAQLQAVLRAQASMLAQQLNRAPPPAVANGNQWGEEALGLDSAASGGQSIDPSDPFQHHQPQHSARTDPQLVPPPAATAASDPNLVSLPPPGGVQDPAHSARQQQAIYFAQLQAVRLQASQILQAFLWSQQQQQQLNPPPGNDHRGFSSATTGASPAAAGAPVAEGEVAHEGIGSLPHRDQAVAQLQGEDQSDEAASETGCGYLDLAQCDTESILRRFAHQTREQQREFERGVCGIHDGRLIVRSQRLPEGSCSPQLACVVRVACSLHRRDGGWMPNKIIVFDVEPFRFVRQRQEDPDEGGEPRYSEEYADACLGRGGLWNNSCTYFAPDFGSCEQLRVFHWQRGGIFDFPGNCETSQQRSDRYNAPIEREGEVDPEAANRLFNLQTEIEIKRNSDRAPLSLSIDAHKLVVCTQNEVSVWPLDLATGPEGHAPQGLMLDDNNWGYALDHEYLVNEEREPWYLARPFDARLVREWKYIKDHAARSSGEDPPPPRERVDFSSIVRDITEGGLEKEDRLLYLAPSLHVNIALAAVSWRYVVLVSTPPNLDNGQHKLDVYDVMGDWRGTQPRFQVERRSNERGEPADVSKKVGIYVPREDDHYDSSEEQYSDDDSEEGDGGFY